ncbi:ATP-binding protein [Gemmatimonas sp.]|uniref:ATP-binding protein n=1 Tax=Gemmatimonas sp. TaxID=1962908 RepID=UPI003F719B43
MPSALFSALALSLLMPTPLSSAAGLANMYTPRVDGQPLHHVTMEMATERTGEVEFADTGIVPITLRTLGDTCILIGTQQLTMQSALLSMLVLRLAYSPQMMVRRDQLLRELWPDQEEVRQRGNLRQALYKLRGMGVRTAIRGDMVCLDEAQLQRTFALTPTVELFERDVTRGAEPYGLFLPGVTAPTPELREWLDQTREALHGDIRRVLADVLRARRERADWSGMHVVARWLLEIDPLNEDGTLGLAECVAMTGSKVEAVGILDRYLAEVGTSTGEIRLPASVLRKRFVEQPARRRSVALVTDKHFVGRDTERSELTMSLRRARWHDGSAVLVHGPPGIGKSRLMSEVLKVAQLEGYHDVVVESRESISIRPLGALIEAIPQLLSAPGAIGCAPESLVVLRKLIGHEGKADAEPEAPEADVLAAELSPAERIEHAMRTMRAQSIRHAVVDLFAAVSEERPIFLLAEDVHWLDNDSWEVLSDVIQRVNEMRVYIVLTGRFSTVKEERPARIPVPLTFRRLAPMAEGALLELIRQVADEHGVEVPPAVDTWIIGGCEGNPLMLRALLEHWVVTGQAVGVPPMLMALIDHRIDRLNGHAQRALQAIGLLNRFASLERVKLVLELPVHELIHAIEQLELSGCLSTSQSSLIITHDLVRQVGMRRMSPLLDAALRAAIGDTLEAEYGRTGDLIVLNEALVNTEFSDRPDVLSRFIRKHEEALIEGGRPSNVLRAIETLSVTMPEILEERQFEILQSRLHNQSGKYRRSLTNHLGALNIPQDIRGVSVPEVEELIAMIDAGYRADPLIDRDELARCARFIAGQTHLPLSTRVRAAEVGLTIAANTCDSTIAAICYSTLKTELSGEGLEEKSQKLGLLYHAVFGDLSIAEKIAGNVLKRSNRRAASTEVALDVGRAAFALRLCGDFENSMTAFKKHFEMSRELQTPTLGLYSAWQLAQIELERGNRDEVSEWNRKLGEILENDEDPISSSFVHAHFCRCAIEDRNKSTALKFLSLVKANQPKLAPPKASAYVVALELGVELISARWAPSEPIIEAALDRHRRTSRFGTSDYLTATIAESMVRAGQSQQAKVFISTYISSERREKAPLSRALANEVKKLE